MELAEEIQIEDNIPNAFQDMDIAHQKFHDRIDRLAEVQMCHVCEESYVGI
jgi:hypothetical protein